MENTVLNPFAGNLDSPSGGPWNQYAGLQSFDGELDGEKKEPGFGARIGQGISRAVDSAKTALTDDPNEIAKIAAEQARTALPQTALQQQMAGEIKPYVDAANKSEGFVDGVTTWGAAGLKRAGQLISNPAETLGMMAEQIPNSLPGLAGGFAGAKAGAALGSLVGPVGTVVGGLAGGVAGGFLGSYGLEKGAAMQEQVQQEAQKRNIDISNEADVAQMVGENYGEMEATAQRKGVGTAGTDAILNVATMGLAGGFGGRVLAKEVQALSAAVSSGTITAAEASAKLAALEASNAARNTLGAKAIRGTGVMGAEMAGEGLSEAVGQKYAYGKVDAGEVIDEALMGLGTGGAMAAGHKAFNKAAGIVDQDAIEQDLQATRAEIEQQVAQLPEHQQPAARAELNAQTQAETGMDGLADEKQGQPNAQPGNPDDEILQSTGASPGVFQRPDPVRQAVQQAADAGGALSAAAGLAMDSGASPTYMPPVAAEQVAEEPQAAPVVLQNRDRTTDASIAQMQEIAANPDYLRAGVSRDMTNGAPVVFGDLPSTAAIGRPETVVDGRGGRVNTQYAIVDAGDVIASNNADGTTVAEYTNGLPGKLRAVAGNGRTAGLQRAYEMGTAGNYSQELMQDAANLGIDPQAVASMQRPVLVRVMSQADITPDMGDRTNTTSTQKLSPVEQAANDARRFSVANLSFDEQGSPTAQSINGFISAMPVAERGDMLNPNGTPTRQAVDRLMAATFKQAYNSDELVQLHAQATDPDARAVLAAAADASGVMAALSDTGEFDVRPAVADAVKLAVNAARQGLKLSDVLQNTDFDVNPEAYPVATFLAQNIRSPKAMAEGLRRWGQLALQNARIAEENQRQGGLLGPAPTMTREEIFAHIGDAYNPTEQSVGPRQSATDPQAQEQQVALQAQSQPTSPAPVDASQVWAAMTADERKTVASTAGLNPVAVGNIGKADWGKINPRIQAQLSQAIAAPTMPPTQAPITDAVPVALQQAAPTTPQQTKAIERLNAGKAVFFSKPKADAFVADNGLADTHEVAQQGKAFRVQAKTALPSTAIAAQQTQTATQKQLAPPRIDLAGEVPNASQQAAANELADRERKTQAQRNAAPTAAEFRLDMVDANNGQTVDPGQGSLLDGAAQPATESGPFGPILTQYRHDAQGAIKALTELQDGEAVAALHHPAVGDIDLVWGKAPEGKAQGLGLAKLLVKHQEVLGDLQGFLNRLQKDDKRSGPNRVRLTDGEGEAVVSLNWKGESKRWLLTAYEMGAEAGTSMDTASNDSKGDTARLEPSSAASVAQSSSPAQAAVATKPTNLKEGISRIQSQKQAQSKHNQSPESEAPPILAQGKGSGASISEVTQVVDDFLAQFAHQAPVVIADSAVGVLPGASNNDVIAGAIHRGRIHLFLDQIPSRTEALKTLWHELLHYGLRRFLTKDQFTAEMTALYRSDMWVRRRANEWVQTAEGATAIQFGGMAYARARGVDEALARLSEEFDGGKESSGLKARTYRKVVQWLAGMADRFNAKQIAAFLRGMTNVEAKAYVRSVFKRLSDDAPATDSDWAFTADPSFSRTESADTEAEHMFGKAGGINGFLSIMNAPVQGVSEQLKQEAVASVRATVDAIRATWGNAPGVEVAFDMSDPAIPQEARDADLRQRSRGATGAPEGFYFKGKVYLLASRLPKSADAARVLLHESLGHYGLHGVFGSDLSKLLNQIATMRKAEVSAKAVAYGLYDRSKLQGADPKQVSPAQILEAMSPRQRLEAAEEVLATMAQDSPELGFVRRAVAAIRTWLRNHVPMMDALALTDDEIINSFILPARGFVERGQQSETGLQSASPFSRNPSTQAAYEARIDALFAGDSTNRVGVRVLDRSDVLGMLGFDQKPMALQESKVIASKKNHPAMLAEYWKRIPQWLENPAAVFDSDTERGSGRLVFVAPEDINGAPVVMIVEPDAVAGGARLSLSLLVNAYDKDGGMPVHRWMRDGLLRYADKKTFPAIFALSVGRQLSDTALQNKPGMKSILTEKHLAGYRRTNPDIRFSRASQAINAAINEHKTVVAGSTNRYTQAQMDAMRDVGFVVEQPSLKERAQALWQDAGKKLAQGIVDQFAPVKEISKDAYALLRLSKGASGAFEALLKGGKLKLSDGVYNFDEASRGGVVDKLLTPLGGEHHDFFRWVAANRAERLMGEGRENLFTPKAITTLKTLADGDLSFDYTVQHGIRKGRTTRKRAEAYRDSLTTFNAFNKNVLDMAEQSGLIDAESRAVWESEFYVPFYRVADEESGGVLGMNIKGSVVRQKAFERLKGGKQKLNHDLLDNTLMNWAHLLDASAKNRAAKATLEAAANVGAAIEAPKGTLDSMAGSINKKDGIVWFMDEGKKRFFMVDDPYLMTAISSLEFAGMNSPIMNVMGSFKRALTIGVTASPFFKVRNLIRDSVQVIGVSGINTNPLKNVTDGWKLTDPKSDAYFRLLAGGGTIHFGTMMEGSEAKRVQALVESGVADSTILNNDHKVKQFYRKFIEPGIAAYNELGNRGEAVNRAALYEQLTKQGMSHAEASLMARDLMDFSMQGSFTSIRFLTQVVPFFNARLQGMYKLGRAAKEDPKRMAYVTGAIAMASLALLATYGDDDDWKKREESDRNNFWWFKIGGTAFRIPKPFELGAIGTLAERSAEYLFDDEMTGKRFRAQVLKLMGDNLSMNPIPQAVKPILDVYANKDSFRDAPIESMGMEKLKPEYRFNDRTSMVARATSTAANAVTNTIGVNSPSPVQIDHMLRGYLGWLGVFAVGTADMIARPATGQPTQAAPDYWKTATGSMVSDLRDAPSRYVSSIYDQAKELEQAYGTWRALQKSGKPQEAAEFFAENRNEIVRHRSVAHAKAAESKLNERIRYIERSDMGSDTKREAIRAIRAQKEGLAKMLAQRG